MGDYDSKRFRYLLNCGRGFLPTRDQWEEIIQLGNAAAEEVDRLRAKIERNALRQSREEQVQRVCLLNKK